MATPKKRYEKLLSDPKHRPRKKKDSRRYDKFLNLVILAAVVSGGIYVIPKKDKEEFAEMLKQLPGEMANAGTGSAEPSEPVSLSSVLFSLLPEGAETPVSLASATNPAATETAAPEPSGFVGREISMSSFPRAYDNWQKNEFMTAEASAEAFGQMNGFLETRPPQLAEVADLRDRKAVIYDDGANLRFLIMIEHRRAAETPPVKTADAGPAPAVMADMPSALSAPRPERSVTDAPAPPLSQGLIARARIRDARNGADGPPITLGRIQFINHAAGAGENLVDLRAELPGARTIYIRGRAPLTVIEDFLARADLTG